MDLWIRSQDRKRLIPNPNLYAVYSKEMSKAYIGDTIVGHIAEYSTEERALEILDEIQNILKPKYILDSSSIKPNGDSWLENGMILQNYNANARIEELSTYVYEMPKE